MCYIKCIYLHLNSKLLKKHPYDPDPARLGVGKSLSRTEESSDTVAPEEPRKMVADPEEVVPGDRTKQNFDPTSGRQTDGCRERLSGRGTW